MITTVICKNHSQVPTAGQQLRKTYLKYQRLHVYIIYHKFIKIIVQYSGHVQGTSEKT